MQILLQITPAMSLQILRNLDNQKLSKKENSFHLQKCRTGKRKTEIDGRN